VGADPAAVQGVALLVVVPYDLLQLVMADGKAVVGGRAQKGLDVHPAVLVERDADAFRPVAQVLGQVLGHAYESSLIHSGPPDKSVVRHLMPHLPSRACAFTSNEPGPSTGPASKWKSLPLRREGAPLCVLDLPESQASACRPPSSCRG